MSLSQNRQFGRDERVTFVILQTEGSTHVYVAMSYRILRPADPVLVGRDAVLFEIVASVMHGTAVLDR
jgi:hypothetical protein